MEDNTLLVRKNFKWGGLDETGKIIIPFIYDDAGSYRDGLSLVLKDDKYGWLDTKGKVIIPLEYDSAKEFEQDLAQVSKDNKIGWIDKTGKTIIPLEYDAYDWIDSPCDYFKVSKNGYWMLIDKKGDLFKKLEKVTTDKTLSQ